MGTLFCWHLHHFRLNLVSRNITGLYSYTSTHVVWSGLF